MLEDRTAFLAIYRDFISDDDMELLEHAYFTAKNAHRHERRREVDEHGNRRRYFDHPKRTALILSKELGTKNVYLACAALLHDTAEDTRISVKKITRFVDPEVGRIVQALTKPPKPVSETAEERETRKKTELEWYTYGIRASGWRAMIVKCADKVDNLRTLVTPGVSDDTIAEQIAEARVYYLPLAADLEREAPFALKMVAREMRILLENELVKLEQQRR